MKEKIILCSSYLLNASVFMLKVSFIVKLVLAALASGTTIMAFMNQYKTFEKNYRTLWIVVSVRHVFSYMNVKPKKRRHRKVNISQNKNTTDDQSNS